VNFSDLPGAVVGVGCAGMLMPARGEGARPPPPRYFNIHSTPFNIHSQHERRIMAKSFLRRSKASGSTQRKIEAIVRRGERATRRAVSARRRETFEKGIVLPDELEPTAHPRLRRFKCGRTRETKNPSYGNRA